MSVPVLIMGRSGSGKTASLRNFQEPVCVINVTKKPLSFKSTDIIKTVNCSEYLKIKGTLKALYEKGFKVAVIDDAGYLMTEKFMNGHQQAKGNNGYELYNEIADNFYSLIKFISEELPEDMIVGVVMHEEMNDMGYAKPKTLGKLLDSTVCIEGMFAIVLRALKIDGKYQFATNTDGLDVTKTPLGMFTENYIDNDFQMVVNKIREYYNIEGEKK